MKFGNMLYSKDEEIALCCAESEIQIVSKRLIGRSLELNELEFLKRKASTEIENLIIKIDSSGTVE